LKEEIFITVTLGKGTKGGSYHLIQDSAAQPVHFGESYFREGGG